MSPRIEPGLAEWLADFRAHKLDEETRDLIAMANWDLNFGPCHAIDYSEEDPTRKTVWPGFEAATDKIRENLRELIPGQLWVADYGDFSESEPDWSMKDEASTDDEPVYELNQEDWGTYDRRDLVQLVVGKELASYCR